MREKASSMCRLRTTNVSDERHKLVHGGRWAFCQPSPKCTCGGPLCRVHFEDPAERAMATGCPLLGKMLDSTSLKSPTSQDFLQKMHKTTLFVADFSSEQMQRRMDLLPASRFYKEKCTSSCLSSLQISL